MNLKKLTDEELDRLSHDIFLEKLYRETMRTLALNRSDIDSAVSHVARCTAFGAIEGAGISFGGAITFAPPPTEIKYTTREELKDLRIAPLDTKRYGTKTGFNPYPMHGVNPSDVFNKKKKRRF